MRSTTIDLRDDRPAEVVHAPLSGPRLWSLVAAALAVVVAALAGLAVLGGTSLPARTGPPVEELAVERTILSPGLIEVTVRNTGPDPVRIAQVVVNDVFVDVRGGTGAVGRLRTATLQLDYPWQPGQPYLVTLLTSTGAVVEHEIPLAATTPDARSAVGPMALIGLYVGVLPVVLGMSVLPLLRRAGPGVVRLLLALTVGLLGFLAVDAGLSALEIGARSSGAYGGPALALLGAGLAYLGLSAIDRALRARGRDERPGGRRLAVGIATGIGLHNLGEGLAIGAAFAVGELALGAFLVAGFALHNTTEGIAIVAPVTRERTPLPVLAGLALLAGGPAIVGAVLGVLVASGELSALLLGLGVGAIVQVIVQISPALRAGSRRLEPAVLGALAAGVLVMYSTGLLVSV